MQVCQKFCYVYEIVSGAKLSTIRYGPFRTPAN